MELLFGMFLIIGLIWLCLKHRTLLKATLIFVAILVGMAAAAVVMSNNEYADRQARLQAERQARQQTKPVEYYHYYEPNPNGANQYGKR